MAADCERQLRTINGKSDLRKALNKLGSIPSSKTLGRKWGSFPKLASIITWPFSVSFHKCSPCRQFEVSWNPQKEDDVLSDQELLRKVPLFEAGMTSDRECPGFQF